MRPSQTKANYSLLQLQLENATVSQSDHKHRVNMSKITRQYSVIKWSFYS